MRLRQNPHEAVSWSNLTKNYAIQLHQIMRLSPRKVTYLVHITYKMSFSVRGQQTFPSTTTK